jgi:TonB family protein
MSGRGKFQMDEPEIDLGDESADTGSPDEQLGGLADGQTDDTGRPIWGVAIAGALLLLVTLFLLFTRPRQSGPTIAQDDQETITAYYTLLGETRTGVRLAQLEAFIADNPTSRYVVAARAQKMALQAHEELGWAKLTDKFFDLELDADGKQAAIDEYTSAWGNLLRAEQIETLTTTPPNDAVPNFNPENRVSKFAKGGEARDLAGGPSSQERTGPVRIYEPTRSGAPVIIEAKIRTRKKPTYPRKAYRRRINGSVTLAIDIDKKGRVVDTRVVSVRASRYAKDFAKASERAAGRSRFYPQTIDGRPVATRGYVVKYTFRYAP